MECSVVHADGVPGAGRVARDARRRAAQPLSFFSLVAGAVPAAVCFLKPQSTSVGCRSAYVAAMPLPGAAWLADSSRLLPIRSIHAVHACAGGPGLLAIQVPLVAITVRDVDG